MLDYLEKAYRVRSEFVHGDDIEDIEKYKYKDLRELMGEGEMRAPIDIGTPPARGR